MSEKTPWYEYPPEKFVENFVFPVLTVVATGLCMASLWFLFDLVVLVNEVKPSKLTTMDCLIGVVASATIWTMIRYLRNDIAEHRLRDGHSQSEYFIHYLTKTSMVVDFIIGCFIGTFMMLLI